MYCHFQKVNKDSKETKQMKETAESAVVLHTHTHTHTGILLEAYSIVFLNKVELLRMNLKS